MKLTGTDLIMTETFTRLSSTDRDSVQLAEDMRETQAETFRIANRDVLSDQDIQATLDSYEVRYGMKSDEFAHRWAAGELADIWEFNDWAILLKHLES